MTLRFYVAAAICDVLGLILTALELRERLAARDRYDALLRSEPPAMMWNADPQVAAIIRALKGKVRDADILAGLNELLEMLERTERRLAGLGRPPGSKVRLWVGLILLACGILLGSAGNINGAR